MKRLLIFFWNLLRPRRDSDDERLRAALLRREEHNEEWFQMATAELDRIKAAKADIIRAIRDAGVEVPEGTRIDELAAYIRLIPKPKEIKQLGQEESPL